MTAAAALVDLEDEILRLKKERNAVLLAHYYQDSEIQDVADFIGDSLQLAQAAAKTKADVICFAGVHFMAETAKILNPERIVVLPDLDAGCSLASGCPADRFGRVDREAPGRRGRQLHQLHRRGEGALRLHRHVVERREDRAQHPGRTRRSSSRPTRTSAGTSRRRSGRKMLLWQGSCIVHETFSLRKLVGLKERHPDALVIAHPECEEPVLAMADYIGSTTALLKYAVASPASEFIVVTEPGILHQMKKAGAGQEVHPRPARRPTAPATSARS